MNKKTKVKIIDKPGHENHDDEGVDQKMVDQMVMDYEKKYMNDSSKIYSLTLNELTEKPPINTAEEILQKFHDTNAKKAISGYSFYKQIFELINQNLQQKNIKKAVELIDEELQMSYVPKEVEEHLNMYEELIVELINKQQEATLGHLTSKELISKAFANFPSNLALLEIVQTKPPGYFQREQFSFIMPYLTAKDTDNHWKIYLFEIFSKVREFEGIEVKMENSDTGTIRYAKIGSQLSSNETNDYFAKLTNLINELVTDEPSLTTLALDLVNRFILFYFPAHPEINVDLLAKEIVQYVYHSLNFNHNVKKRSETSLLIDKILTKVQI